MNATFKLYQIVGQFAFLNDYIEELSFSRRIIDPILFSKSGGKNFSLIESEFELNIGVDFFLFYFFFAPNQTNYGIKDVNSQLSRSPRLCGR